MIFRLLLTTIAFAAPQLESTHHIHGTHPECPIPKSAQDILACVLKEHPRAKRAALALESAKHLPEEASQIPNPEVDVESGFGRPNGQYQDQVQFGLMQPVEWGGKRAARIDQANAQIKEAEAQAAATLTAVAIETVLKLHRLRQIEEERGVLNETANAFKKIEAQQKSRPNLAPDQKIAVSIYGLAAADATFKLTELQQEERAIEHFFHISAGHSLAEIKPVLPAANPTWPKLQEKAEIKSPRLLQSEAELKIADANVSSANAEAWPGFKVGPMITTQKAQQGRQNLLGVRLTLELPLWNRNQGGRAVAEAGRSRFQSTLDLTIAEDTHERFEQLKSYQDAVEALTKGPSHEALQAAHLDTERFAQLGLAPAPLIVESHRQQLEIIKSIHGQELKALEALWNIYGLDGRILEERL